MALVDPGDDAGIAIGIGVNPWFGVDDPERMAWAVVDEAIRNGDPGALGGLVRVEAPPGVHIIDHVSRDWLWRQPRPLVKHSLPAALRERVKA